MDIMKLGTQLLQDKLSGSSAGENNVGSALTDLLGDNDGNLDISSLVSKVTGDGNLTSTLSSWLGDGDNDLISGDAIKNIFDSNELSNFASKLGVDVDSAADSLADAIPQMVDKSSSGGSLLDSISGLKDGLDAANKFFSK